MKYTPRSTSDKRLTQGSETPVTLPAMPFDMPTASTDETAPRSATIRRKMRKVSKPNQLPCSRPVFDHGEVWL